MVYATEHRNLDLLHYCNFMLRVSWVATSRWSSCVRAIRCSLFVNRLTKAILVKEQLSFILCFFFPQDMFIIFCRYSLNTGMMFRLDSWEAATLERDQEEGAPGSTSRPRCDWCDGWMWTSHCNNMSISVTHCLALSHHCVCSKSTGSLLCVLPFSSQKKKDS